MNPGSAPAAPRPALYVGACAGLIAFSAALLASASSLPFAIPWYLPLARAWQIATHPPGTGIAMDYYGRVGVALAVGAIASVIASLASRGRKLPPTLLRAAGVWAVGITVLGMLWYAWAFSHRVVTAPSDAPAATDADSDSD
ncbi:MAG TPA: hypothetical protein VMV18_10100 [bacterium]|nr:hypothetical protein [bacterium]